MVKGDSEYYGIVETEDGRLVCDVCGGNTMKTTMHMDYTDHFVNSGYCTDCKNPITISTKRSDEDKMYWG